MKTSWLRIRAGLICLLIMFAAAESVSAQEKGVNNVSTANQINKKRIALVIGNSNYGDDIGKLKNPSNDAVDVAETLKNLGFKLVGDKANLDLNLRQTDELVREFGRQIKAGGVGVFYYSGHGIQVNRVNYLIPLGARIEKQQDVPFETLSIDRVLGEMEAAENNLNILILDACRNNPLSRSVRSADKGLAQPERIPTGTYIAFAAKDGQTASDNQKGRNGLYTSELLKNLKQPDLRLEDVFINTRREVRKLSNNSQTPEEYGSVDDVFFFNPKSQSASTVSTNQNGKTSNDGEASNIAKTEKQAFVKIQKSNDIIEVRAVLEQYPSSEYAPAAKARLDKLVWESVKSTKDKAKIRAYLDEFQTGQFAAAAKIELGKLNAAETSPKPQPTPDNGNSAVKPGKGAIRRNSLGIEFVFVPPGSFQMGTNETYPNPDENPLHKVTIRDGFFMGKTEVTQGQWRAVMNENPSHFQGDKNQLGNDDNLPVEKVSWEDAKEFIKKLNAKNDGFEYRLPSEAEWEYAARAGTTNDFPGQLIDIAWYANNSGRNYLNAQEISQNDDKNYFKRVRTENKGQPHPVATKSPNAFGLFDMHGNVWEWCEDVYKYEGYKNVPTDGSPNLTEGAGGSKIRVLRGGSWYDSEETFRLGNRSKGIGTYDRIGFRLAMRLK